MARKLTHRPDLDMDRFDDWVKRNPDIMKGPLTLTLEAKRYLLMQAWLGAWWDGWSYGRENP